MSGFFMSGVGVRDYLPSTELNTVLTNTRSNTRDLDLTRERSVQDERGVDIM